MKLYIMNFFRNIIQSSTPRHQFASVRQSCMRYHASLSVEGTLKKTEAVSKQPIAPILDISATRLEHSDT